MATEQLTITRSGTGHFNLGVITLSPTKEQKCISINSISILPTKEIEDSPDSDCFLITVITVYNDDVEDQKKIYEDSLTNISRILGHKICGMDVRIILQKSTLEGCKYHSVPSCSIEIDYTRS